jgi:NAD(P)-dependent dehydrogenase (short-subunit alcohol dehydrogenase family)
LKIDERGINLSTQTKVVVITGATRGIGYNIAKYFSEHGYKVIGAGRDQEKLKELEQMLQSSPAGGAVYGFDVNDYVAVAGVTQQIVEEHGAIDVWINNAGVSRAIGPTWEGDAQEWAGNLSTNLVGTFNGIRAVIPIMLKQGAGCIINILGGGTKSPEKYNSSFSAAKTGVARLTETLVLELKDTGKNVRVFGMIPGLTDSNMTKYLRETEIGRKYFPNIEELFQKGKTTPPEKAPELARKIVEGLLDEYQGRIIGVNDNVEALQQQGAHISEQHFTLRLAKD